MEEIKKKKYPISFQVDEELAPVIEDRIKAFGCTKNAFYEFAIELLLLRVDTKNLNIWQNQAFKSLLRKYK